MNESMRALGEAPSKIREIFEYGCRRKAQIGEDAVFDFSLGNPSVEPPESVNTTLISLLKGESDTRLHGYTSAAGAPDVREAIAEHLNRRYATDYHKDEIYLTAGAAAALTAVLTALLVAGDEVIVNVPYFPEYRVFIERCGARVIEAPTHPNDFMPDIEAVRRAITERTQAIIINSPNNPTGTVIPPDTLRALAAMLCEESARIGHPIYLISDEPYREIVYGDKEVAHAPSYYRDSVVCYSYSKSLSIPGERIGYVLIPRVATEGEALMHAVWGAGRALGFVCAPSLFQHLLPYVLDETADIRIYEKNRELLYRELSSLGFSLVPPDGAFYLFVKAPMGDAQAFAEEAKKEEILFVPSDSFGIEGYVRISYCVKTETVLRALAAFRRLRARYGEFLY